MSAVDVLAVMDWQIRQAKHRKLGGASGAGALAADVGIAKLEAARAAVAELIEADKRVAATPLDHLPDDYPCVITVFAGDLRRRNAALARAGAA